jgi:hypothetical protein
VVLTRLHSSRNATARALAPPEEALDTPLNPPPLDDEPGPATRRSGTYRDGTSTRKPDPTSRTQHQDSLGPELIAQNFAEPNGKLARQPLQQLEAPLILPKPG